MKHGDSKQQFATGAQRDTQLGKLRYDLISPFALKRLATIYTKGAEHYGDRNWEKGIPFSRMIASMQRHTMAFLMGETDEDHLGQAVWNGMGILHFQEMIERGVLPAGLDDMPEYGSPTPPFKGEAAADYQYLCNLGCPRTVAAQVIGGTTYAEPVAPGVCPKYVYIAGPMRGYPEFNFPAFDKARDRFIWLGFNVISPADIDRAAHDVNAVEGSFTCDQSTFVFRDFWANYFLKKIDICNQNGIVLLNYWTQSTGAAGEFFLDRWLDLKVFRPDGSVYRADEARHDFALAHAALKEPPCERMDGKAAGHQTTESEDMSMSPFPKGL